MDKTLKEKIYQNLIRSLAIELDISIIEDSWICNLTDQRAEAAVKSFLGIEKDKEQMEELCTDMDSFAKED